MSQKNEAQKNEEIMKDSPFSTPINLDLPETKAESPWWGKKLNLFALALTVLWGYIATDYFVTAGWWSNRFEMSPPEFVGFISGMVLPIVIIWLLVAYFERGMQFERESKMLRAYMNQLIYPTEEGAMYTKSLTDALRLHIKEFRSVFAQMTDQVGKKRSVR